MVDEVDHRTRDRPVQGPGEAERVTGWGDEATVNEFLSVLLHELTNGAQRTLDEMAGVVDSLAKHHGQIERLRVAQHDVLRSIRHEYVRRPSAKGFLSSGRVGKAPALIWAFSA